MRILPAVELAEAAYRIHGDRRSWYEIARTDGVGGLVTTAEMRKVYKDTFVRSAGTRSIYDAIKKLPENDICPLCGQRTVSTLDHYLPQSGHPALVVTAINLVPACSDCNKIKLAKLANCEVDQTLHPYFDSIDHDRWLFATVQESAPAALVFWVAPPESWGEVIFHRIDAHFREFELGKLYASHSAVELGNIRYGLQQIATAGSVAMIKQHLRREAASRSMSHPNSWQRATYEALADSDWFCNGGFAF